MPARSSRQMRTERMTLNPRVRANETRSGMTETKANTQKDKANTKKDKANTEGVDAGQVLLRSERRRRRLGRAK